MANTYFQFKEFRINQDRCAMKVTTDGCLFGAWVAGEVGSRELEDGSRELEDGIRESGVGRRESEDGGRESEDGSRKTEVGSRELEDGGRESEDGIKGATPTTVLDIGTGTGLLSLMLTQKIPSLFIDALEIDQDAFEQASQNVIESPWAGKINVIHANARGHSFTKKYDVLISNPPFYDNELKGDDTKRNLAHHDAGLILPDLLQIIKENINPNGIFFLLLPYKRNGEIIKLLAVNALIAEQISFIRQTPAHDYFRIMLQGRLAGADAAETLINEITIKDKEDQYSPEFVSLLQDYYFYL